MVPAVPFVKRARVRVPTPETVYFVPAPPEMEDFQSSRIISKVKPVYPEIARLAKVEGTVRFKAIIGADGTVQNLALESGPTMLAQAAIEAIRQWTFLPATRNGDPVEDTIHIDVGFTLIK
jgi:periplasmic protein TonB